MAEEELILTVRVDDQASAQIGALKASLSQMGTGAQAAGQERVRRQSRESAEGAAHLTREMRGMAVTMGVIGGVVGGVTAKITELGLSFLSRVTDVKGYATEMMKLQQASYIAGTSSAQMQANIDIFRQSGVSADRAGSQIQNFSEAIADMSRVNSETRRNLMRGLRPGEVSDMRAFIDDIMSSDPAEALNKVKSFGEDIRKYQTELYGPEAGARAQQRFYATFGVPDLSRVRGQFLVVTEDQKKLFKDRQDAADRYYSSTVKASVMWDRASASITAVALHLLPISGSMESIADYSEKVVGSLQDWEREFRKTDGSFAEFIRVTQEWGAGLDNWVGREIAKLATGAKGFVEDLKIAHKWLQDIGVLENEPPKPGSRADLRQKQMEEFKRREAQTAPEREAERKAAERRELEDLANQPMTWLEKLNPRDPRNIAREQLKNEREKEAAEAAAITAAQATADSRKAAIQTKRLRRGPATATALPEGGYREDVPRQEPVPLLGPATPTPEPVPPAPPQSILRVTPTPSTSTELGLPTVAAPSIPSVSVRPPEAVVRRAPSPLTLQQSIPDVVAQPPTSSPATIEQPFSERFGDWPQPSTTVPQIVLPKPIVPAPSGQEQPAPINSPVVLPPREKVSFNQEQPMPSAFASVRNIDLAGTGPAPWMAGGEKGQSQDWMDFASAGAAMDRASQREVNVNGTGKISVDVRAPNGTNVQAQGEGLFRKTEISRQVQMEPAMSGPALPAGAVMAG